MNQISSVADEMAHGKKQGGNHLVDALFVLGRIISDTVIYSF
jgi:hypothetical protein